MTEDLFWEIIEKAKGSDYGLEHANRLTMELKKLNQKQILRFYKIYADFHNNADKGDVWAASLLLNGGYSSDDGFEYFRNWLIAQGKDTYEKAVIQPDSLALTYVEQDSDGRPDTQWEDYGYAAGDAYKALTKRNIHDDTEQSHSFSSIHKALSGKTDNWDWQDYTDKVLAEKLPNLWEKYGKFKQQSDRRTPKDNSATESLTIEGLGKLSVGDSLIHRKYGLGKIKSLAKPNIAIMVFSDTEKPMILDFSIDLWKRPDNTN